MTLNNLLADKADKWPCESPIDDPKLRGQHANDWYPKEMYYDAATRLCNGCPVRTACLQFALDTDEEHGIWGGTTPEQRKSLKRRLAKKQAAVA